MHVLGNAAQVHLDNEIKIINFWKSIEIDVRYL